MRERLLIFCLIIISVFIQVVLAKYTRWTPDLILLMVIFTGVFRSPREAVTFGILAGFLRGIFSVGTFPVDILLFPILGAASFMLAEMFYRENLFTQIFITSLALFALAAAHISYFNIISGNDIRIPLVFLASWRTFFTTIIISPFIFHFLKNLSRLEGF